MLRRIARARYTATALTGGVLLFAAALSGCGRADTVTHAAGGPTAGAATDTRYTTSVASRDGIGRRYMGREISQVMGHRGAAWLERPLREREERTDLLIAGLPLAPDDVVADIGAGTGFFSFPVAARVPQGRVLAVDIQPEMLEIIARRRAATGIDNVEPVLGSVSDPNLSPASVDLAFIVDAYHEFSHPWEMGSRIAAALKPGALLVLIEYRAEDPDVPIKPLHKMSEAQAKAEMQAIGLEWLRTEDFLPQQHFMVFRRPPGDATAAR